MSKSNNLLLVGIMKNEGPYILEWIAHYMALGVDRFLIISNDCTDLTDRMLDVLDTEGIITHVPNPKSIFQQLGAWHVAALRYATQFNMYKDADWLLAVDTDEFIEVQVGDHRLPDLYQALPDFDVLSMSVVGYNSSNVKQIGDGNVQDTFLQTQRPLDRLNDPAAGLSCAVKSICANPIDRMMFRNHRPKIDGFSGTGRVWLDGSGRAKDADFTDRKVNAHAAAGTFDLVQVNHHSLRSMESFIVKADRGDAVTDARMGIDQERVGNAISYWQDRNRGLDIAPRQVHKPKGYEGLYRELRSHSLLGEMHEESLARHRKTVAKMIATRGGETLASAIGYV